MHLTTFSPNILIKILHTDLHIGRSLASLWVPADVVSVVARFSSNRLFFNEIDCRVSRVVLRGNTTNEPEQPRKRKQEYKNATGLTRKTKTLNVQQTFQQISLPSSHD